MATRHINVALLLSFALMLTGCATDFTCNPRYSKGLEHGTEFELKDDAFFYVYEDRQIIPQNSSDLSFSTQQWINREIQTQRDMGQYIKGVVPKGSRIKFTKIIGRWDFATGRQPYYFGKVTTGSFKSWRSVRIDSLLFDLRGSLTDKYLKKID